ncbi:MAG: hypothetical protein JNM35_01215, partial [Nitrospira sp.]|nr:hypothetical protein [Nitrospira sp.]
LLGARGCWSHRAHALDLFRSSGDGTVQVSSAAEALAPLSLYRLDHGDPAFMKRSGR